MRIGQKLVLSFLIVASLIWGVGFLAITKSQKALQETIGENSIVLVQRSLDDIDRTIYYRIERWKSYSHRNPLLYETLEKSNHEFENLNNRQEYIKRIDRDWKEGKDTPFIQGILKNKLSEGLRERTEFYEKHQGYNVFPEVFVTNKYGVIIASTGEKSDYLQADKEWYQKTVVEEAFWIGDVGYDESSDTYACDIGISLYDDEGEFSGIIKVVLNTEDVIGVIREMGVTEKHSTTEFKLCTKNGKIIYSTEDFKFFENISDGLLSCFRRMGEHRGYFVAEGDKPGEGEELFAHAHSRGYKGYKGLGWILIVEYETEEIFAPVAELKNLLLVIAFVVTILGVLIGLFISRSISNPLAKLECAAIEIGKGKLDTKVEIDSTCEMGQLAASFNKMTEDLQITTTSIDNLNAANQQLEFEISERKQAERELLWIKSAADDAVDAIIILGQEQEVVYANMAFGNMLKCTTDSINEVGFNSIYTDKEMIKGILQDTEAGDIWEGEIQLVSSQGRKFPASLDVTPIVDEQYEIIGTLFIIRDITVHKEMEMKIRNLAKFPSEDPYPVLRISANCKIIYANNASTPILKAWKCREGQTLQPPECKLVKEVLNSGAPTTFDLDCNDRIFSVTMAPIVKSGYVNIYGLDVTKLKLSEENLEQVKKQAMIKSQFVSTVSHELRTPLTSMKGSVAILLNGAVGEINDKQKELLGITERNVDRLIRLINDILNFQKLEAKKSKFVMQRNDMNEVVEEIKETMLPVANEKQLSLVTNCEHTLPAVSFDKDKIIQVLTNLVDNALKFTEKGSITITTAKSDNIIRVSVEDTGIGIKKDDLPKLFNEFEQLSDVDNRKIGGTGLGLAISQKIIKEHSGKIWAESKFGKGTTFSFVLPINE